MAEVKKDKPHIHVVAAVIRHKEKVLAVRRPEGKEYAGYWEFPGGKIEPGESPEQALSRELAEELDIRPARASMWLEKKHDYGHFVVTLLFFQVTAIEGTPRSLEGQALEWMDGERALAARFLPADTEVVRCLFNS